jgi:NADH-quinone oxidoreductase subunit D
VEPIKPKVVVKGQQPDAKGAAAKPAATPAPAVPSTPAAATPKIVAKTVPPQTPAVKATGTPAPKVATPVVAKPATVVAAKASAPQAAPAAAATETTKPAPKPSEPEKSAPVPALPPPVWPAEPKGTEDVAGERMILNMGPSHPCTHGVFRIVLELDGEVVMSARPEVGYLHRGDEKIAENLTYNQFVPYTDRLDYLSPLANNVAYVLAVEKLMRLQVPPRCQYIRVICCEMARVASHLVGLGAMALDLAAMTVFLYTFTERERLLSLMEKLTGARLTNSYTRVGGVARDLPNGWIGELKQFLGDFPRMIDEVDRLLTRNRIFMDRNQGVGVLPKDVAIDFGVTGPNLRGSGVEFDLRKNHPYLCYKDFEFDVPVGTTGDCYDRYLVRMEEMRQSVRILKQACDKLPDGPVNAPDLKSVLPPKEQVLTKMEQLIHHFMIVTEGPDVPPGEVYFGAENPKGELGFYIVSKGGGVPWRMKIRSPSFCNLSALPYLLKGHMIGDIAAILGSLDFVMGECDR